MKKYNLILAFILLISSYGSAQLTLEAFVTTGTNMMIRQKNFHPESPLWGFQIHTDFNGINAGGNLGARLFIFDKKWSLGASVGYLWRYHVSGVVFGNTSIHNTEYFQDFICLPLDIGYHFQSGIGLHLGLEFSWFLTPYSSHPYLDISKSAIYSPLVGVSYTYKRFRFDLIYKHSVNSFLTSKYDLIIQGQQYTDRIFYRYHDIELRIAFKIFQFKDDF